MTPQAPKLTAQTTPFTVRIPRNILTALETEARQHGIPTRTLLKQMLIARYGPIGLCSTSETQQATPLS
jgi:predicted DNA binding CopG/RHH family protein